MKSMGFGTPSNDGAKYVVWLQTFGQVVGLWSERKEKNGDNQMDLIKWRI
jgi:hypothetical protein